MLMPIPGALFYFPFCGFAASLYGGPGCFPFRSRQTRIFYECCAAFLLMCMLRSKLAVRGVRLTSAIYVTDLIIFSWSYGAFAPRQKHTKSSFQASLRSFFYAFLLTIVSSDHSKTNTHN
jgi:hypothetical protein